MIKHFYIAAAIALGLSGNVFAADTSADNSGRPATGKGDSQAAAALRCDKLAGAEKDLCLRQARESHGARDRNATGATGSSASGQAGGKDSAAKQPNESTPSDSGARGSARP